MMLHSCVSVTSWQDKWDPLCNKEESVELFQYVSLMTLDSIMKCAFSYNSNCQTDNDNSYTGAVYDLASLTQQRIRTFPYHSDLIYYLSPHGLRFRRACQIAHQHTDKVIEQRKKLLEKNEELEKIQQKRHPDFLDILLCSKVSFHHFPSVCPGRPLCRSVRSSFPEEPGTGIAPEPSDNQ
ncbi:hypothetical protein AB205_0143080 [Aquarana catesbeiana]|uniref:Uncharacterized protein n=1 Tax=Aquarana catesbeiana TaxID=8400 RepID=A0A2G9QI16_AQUCT|nr:hypothetical protein AB205_0143080 [Aquarana catesbeiana]